MAMEEKDAKRVLEWQEDVARCVTSFQAEVAERPPMPRRERTASTYYPEPIIYNLRPKMPLQEGSSRSGARGKSKPLYGKAKNARNIGADNIIHGPNPDRYRRDNDLNH